MFTHGCLCHGELTVGVSNHIFHWRFSSFSHSLLISQSVSVGPTLSLLFNFSVPVSLSPFFCPCLPVFLGFLGSREFSALLRKWSKSMGDATSSSTTLELPSREQIQLPSSKCKYTHLISTTEIAKYPVNIVGKMDDV